MEPESLPVVVRDVFPARATVPVAAIDPDRDMIANIGTRDGDNYTLRGCRVVVTRERLYVWATPFGTPRVVYEREWSSPDPRTSAASTPGDPGPVMVSVGGGGGGVAVVESDPAAGCGCGSPLKSLQPFVPYRTGPL